MGIVFLSLGIAALVALLLYCLYWNGYAILNVKAALFYIGYPRWGKRKNCIRARFAACTGLTRQVVCLLPDRQYQFTLSAHLNEGSVSVEIYEGRKTFLARLDAHSPTAIISTDTETRFQVFVRLRKADGDYKLVWDEEA